MQGCSLYTCETQLLRGREMAESSDAVKQMVSQGLLGSPCNTQVHIPGLPVRSMQVRGYHAPLLGAQRSL